MELADPYDIGLGQRALQPEPSSRPPTKLPSARSTPGFSRTPRPVDWPSFHWPA